MATWSDFYPFVLPEVSGCPAPQINHALRSAAREFCERSRAWQERAAALAGDASTKNFAVTVPASAAALGGELVRIERCTVAGIDYDVSSFDNMPADWLETVEANALTRTCVQISEVQCRIYATPAAGDNVQLYLSMKPTLLASTGVGDVILNKWGEQMAAGALKRLWAMVGKPWSKPEGVALAHDTFERGVHLAANVPMRQNKPMRTGRAIL